MYLCREAIRKHLLQMSPVNLFVQIPQLGLPTLLQEYLLFNVALDDDDNGAAAAATPAAAAATPAAAAADDDDCKIIKVKHPNTSRYKFFH